MTNAFPWKEAMHVGLGVMRLPPQQFWQITPRELAAICGIHTAAAPLSKIDLKTLMQRFPDG